MAFFNKQFLSFFKELEQNNSKDWFDANRNIYETEIKKPFKSLVESLILKLQKDLPEINPNASKSIFRINRDIRFSKNKAPYKTHVAAVFARKGTKDMDYPGFYIHLGANELMAGGGSYMLSKEQLAKVRQEIYYNPEIFKEILNAKSFKSVYSEILGDKNKVLPSDYKEFVQEQPLIANKSFYYMAKLPTKLLLEDNFDETLYKQYFKPAYGFNKFLLTALEE
ncbi:MAG TPA: DUF2461 domain-containing protein [Chitinophagales bacterium]|nr:DUF2461 domain-containing protein [Chitinophagales bacterium]HRP39056.1 DUF2461 domain-containing protein [Chitinophagales bacterium]